jgi:undecaprenyl-diphosphatase
LEPKKQPGLLKKYVQGRLRGIKLTVLLLLLLLVVMPRGFLELADEVGERQTWWMDETILLSMRNPEDVSDPLGPVWVEEMCRDITALGSVSVLVAICIAATIYLLLMGRRRAAVLVLAAVFGGLALSFLMKIGYDRPRPDVVPHGAEVHSPSFPSGHAMMAASSYFTLSALLAVIHTRRSVKTYFLFLAAGITLAVGASRAYLGVHWPSDVLAGWAAGITWAIICWLFAIWMPGGKIEKLH